jgi:uncharacterized protein YyaL (SSP411 family)
MQSNFARLALLTGESRYQDKAASIHQTFAAQAIANPFGYAAFLEASLDLIDPVQVIMAGSPGHPAASTLVDRVIRSVGPACIIGHITAAGALPANHPAHRKTPAGYSPRLYLCRGHVCAAPAATINEVDNALATLGLEH